MLMGSFLCIWEATCTSQIIIFSVSLFPHCVFVLSPVPQSHLTLCDLVDCSPPGSSAHRILFSRQEYWSWLPSPTPEDLPDPGIQPLPLAFTALAGGVLYHCTTWEGLFLLDLILIGNKLSFHFNSGKFCFIINETAVYLQLPLLNL